MGPIASKLTSRTQSTSTPDTSCTMGNDPSYLALNRNPSYRGNNRVSRHASVKKKTSLLNEPSRTKIKNSWKTVQQKLEKNPSDGCTNYGMAVFVKVFQACPELKEVFQVEKEQKLDNLPENHPFLRHTKVFANILDLMVRNVDELEAQITPALLTYGRRHYYKHRVGFTPNYMVAFSTAMLAVVQECMTESWEHNMESSWAQILRYMMDKMKEGYDLEQAMNHKKVTKSYSNS